MKAVLRIFALIVFLIMLCLCGLLVADAIPTSLEGMSMKGNYEQLGIVGGDPPPGRGSCSGVGKNHPDNPFSGWPLDYEPGNWEIITSWYCDPDYFEGYTHWGIDLGSAADAPHTVAKQPAIVTTDKALVLRASCCSAFNHGMGNYVMLLALDCQIVDEIALAHRGVPEPDVNGDGQITAEAEYCEETEWRATYMHLWDVTVSPGDVVERGTVVGHVDSTGNSTGHHLHYQINGPDGAIDPAPSMAETYDDALRSQPQWDRNP